MYNLMIVDDELIIREGLKQLDWGKHNITVKAEVKNGFHALELLETNKMDIILSDIKMPGMTGIEMAKVLKEKGNKCKIILLSGYDDFQYAKEAMSLNVYDYILKPATPKEIFEVVDRICELIESEEQEIENIKNLEIELDKYRGVIGSEIVEEEDTNIKKIVKYIYTNYMDELTLSLLADKFHFTSAYLSTYIKRNTGHTFLEILTSIRMYHAARLLETTSLKQGEIGRQVGILDERYFGQVFKKVYDTTPQEYKKNKLDNARKSESLLQEIKRMSEEE